jgi:hypothetical protein
MKAIRQRKPRLRLNPDSYRKLRTDVLERDGWRCQNCGTSECLQVHHIRSRGAVRHDVAENLITPCADCHRLVYRFAYALKPASKSVTHDSCFHHSLRSAWTRIPSGD